MKILIIGSTGRTGQELVKRSLEQGHEVTAFARDPAKIKMVHKNLTVIKGDALDKNSLVKALQGNEAVISAIGRGDSLRSENLISNVVEILIPAMKETGIKRLIMESGFGAGETFSQANFLQRLFFKLLLKDIYGDKAKAEKQIRNSDLDWTLVYPVRLTNKGYTGKYKVGEKLPMKGMPTVSRADVAEFMVDELANNAFVKGSPIITS